jgi:hypothetical protein
LVTLAFKSAESGVNVEFIELCFHKNARKLVYYLIDLVLKDEEATRADQDCPLVSESSCFAACPSALCIDNLLRCRIIRIHDVEALKATGGTF